MGQWRLMRVKGNETGANAVKELQRLELAKVAFGEFDVERTHLRATVRMKITNTRKEGSYRVDISSVMRY